MVNYKKKYDGIKIFDIEVHIVLEILAGNGHAHD